MADAKQEPTDLLTKFRTSIHECGHPQAAQMLSAFDKAVIKAHANKYDTQNEEVLTTILDLVEKQVGTDVTVRL
jgi:hypothetical protein